MDPDKFLHKMEKMFLRNAMQETLKSLMKQSPNPQKTRQNFLEVCRETADSITVNADDLMVGGAELLFDGEKVGEVTVDEISIDTDELNLEELQGVLFKILNLDDYLGKKEKER